jgi:Co/Zn/Cd efflux system component
MHRTDPSRWKHGHDFTADFSTAERNTRRVLMLTAVMMMAEIIFGLKFHSMALFADGLHMGTHVAAFLITVLAYFFARRHASDASFSFGTGKFGVLGAFTSAIVLGGIGLVMAGESVGRLIHPVPIQFNQAIVIACLGLAVNVVSALPDLHIWQVGVNKFAASISVVAHHPKAPDEYRQRLKIHEELVHVIVETQTCHESV